MAALTGPAAAAAEAPVMELHTVHHRRERAAVDADPTWFGTFDIVLTGADSDSFPPGSRLAVWCQSALIPGPDSNAEVLDELSGLVVLAPLDRAPIEAEHRWVIDGLRGRRPARHANDGPEAAYVVDPHGTVTTIHVVAATTSFVSPEPVGGGSPGALADTPTPALVPMPCSIEVGEPGDGPVVLRVHPPEAIGVAALAARLGLDVFADASIPDRARPVDVDVVIDTGVGEGRHTIVGDRAQATVTASDRAAARHALTTLAQLAATGGWPTRVAIDDRAMRPMRIVHLDLARRWYEPDVVGRLIDLAAWRKFSHVHLHLTDDEAWRFPVPEYPTLATVGGTRGHGLAVPPLCGSGGQPYGRAYTAAEIRSWVERADDVGVVLVPEVDVPAHCFAALAAVPELRDPDDTSGAVSVQGFTDNVLVPGHPGTEAFLAAVFTTLAALFPTSPVLHVGGDEVPHGAWRGSPLAQRYAAERGLTTTAEIAASFHRDLQELIATTTKRSVAAWEEVGFGGAAPSAYAVAWTSAEAGHRLAEAGHRVVMAPAQAYYLDMAADRSWASPGATWAGTVPIEVTCAFDPTIEGIDALAGELVGVQACIWGEHVSSLEVLDALVFPRLDAVAERGWTGIIAGGAESLVARAAALPRFTTA